MERNWAAHWAAEQVDKMRDADFSPAVERFITDGDIEELAELLIGTDDDIEIGLSQLGIDPDGFSPDDLDDIWDYLHEHGVRLNGDTGTWECEPG